ncbi:DUF2919 domain-containing protein [Vibrio porteresiae]|uniref:DUF2919 domain-containing protein n=1 Tax=Vibrio porteresiae DSM 19223 TaxID=1123496 RepID=A0ABZ0QFS9_9VIBR|nr:DUF2919 domain-containing protein [Vibrio porteresiae]WPC74841.1 DUF2919 domain-containing protein [Vibrio porteresiae DSM 19223]
MRYSVEQYDHYGYLKAPIWLWFTWVWLIKAWIVLVMAGASQEAGPRLLALIYPQKSHFYTELALGIPALLLMWMIHLRRPDGRVMTRVVQRCARLLTLLSLWAQLGLTSYYVLLQHGQFHWFSAVSIVLCLWLLLYVWRSETIKACFAKQDKINN